MAHRIREFFCKFPLRIERQTRRKVVEELVRGVPRYQDPLAHREGLGYRRAQHLGLRRIYEYPKIPAQFIGVIYSSMKHRRHFQGTKLGLDGSSIFPVAHDMDGTIWQITAELLLRSH